jgi:hypothetical protein
MGARRWTKREEYREEWAIILKGAMVKLYELYAKEEEQSTLLLQTRMSNRPSAYKYTYPSPDVITEIQSRWKALPSYP